MPLSLRVSSLLRCCRVIAPFIALFLLVTHPSRVHSQEQTNGVAKSFRHEVVRLGQDAYVGADESVSKVVVIKGDARIDGEVRDEVVVVGGTLHVTGKLKGTVVVVFGDIDASPTAVLRRQAIVVGGRINAEPGARLRPDNQVISLDRFPMLQGMVSWVTHGALYLRPLPPDVRWAWFVPPAFLLLYALMSLVLTGPSDACVRVLSDRPITCYAAGLFGMCILLLSIPVLLILGAVIAGFVLLLAMFLAVLFGRMAVIRFVGFQLSSQLGLPILEKPLLSLLVGSVLLSLIYMVPVFGFVVWAGIFPPAVGALMLAGFAAIRPARSVTPPFAQNPAAPPSLQQETLNPSSLNPANCPPAGFFVRLTATLIDLILIGCLSAFLGLHGRGFWITWTVYHVAMWSWRGATLGGRVFGIRVVETDGTSLTLSVALVRALAAVLSALPLFLGFIWAAWDVRKQSWHDKLTGTVMVWKR